ncbi:alpha-tocopherol transfer protein-like [Culicoides brevitarsis]|uniref:alpha-tocopherol transfer protein-like n=1 Tax=Culicoides brevitarsis TaxID=469753 RepID=UPI00307C2089
MDNNNVALDHPAMKKLAKIARDELRETEATREESLRQMREWLKQNKDVKNVRDDESFLLRFLRTKKYSILMAQQQLLKYLNLRRVLCNYVTALDFLSPNLQHLVNQGYMFVSPIRDEKGRRVIISTASNFDIDRCNSEDLVKTHFMTYETLVENEADQVLGFVHVGDFGSVGPKHVAMFNITGKIDNLT